MADAAITEGTAKLQLDEETGEYVSKSELKKRINKRAKKAAQAKLKSEAPPKEPKQAAKKEEVVVDINSIFKEGFLDRVYKERPTQLVVTRFPPEPNGLLHLGHAKAMLVNFGFARYHGGKCILRFDDTNPEKEEEKYFTAIKDMVAWLGFTPSEITYASDNFDRLYLLAEELIRREKAYVCHCSEEEVKLQRGGESRGPRYRCEHANQSVEENLTKFRAMRDGKYAPKEASLRFKQDINSPNPQMWDVFAYRVLNAEHYRTKDKWKIYPLYDFAHSLCDAMEGITHSLCTTEFINSRTSYEWLNRSLEVFDSMQREYGRLSISGTVLSKRKIMKLVQGGYVRDWNDPRLYTLVALKRRGVPPGAILEFVAELGVTTATTTIQRSRFDQTIRNYLERTVPRLSLVLDPLRVVIEDDGFSSQDIDVPFSKDPLMGSHKVKFTKTLFIDSSDFREVDSPEFFRLAPGKSVGLLQAPYPVTATSFTKENGRITEVRAVFDKSGKKPKAYIQWVPEDSKNVEARIYDPLFKSDNPEDVTGGFLNDINPNSEIIYKNALIEAGGFDEVRRRAPWPEDKVTGESSIGKGGPESVRFQALRIAYFALDEDSVGDKIVLNKIVSLKEDAGK